MTAIHALMTALLVTAALAPLAGAEPLDVCVRDGQVVTGSDCYSSMDDGPLVGPDVCIRDGKVVTGPDCYG